MRCGEFDVVILCCYGNQAGGRAVTTERVAPSGGSVRAICAVDLDDVCGGDAAAVG